MKQGENKHEQVAEKEIERALTGMFEETLIQVLAIWTQTIAHCHFLEC